jgi:hypothetical protein
MATGYAAMTLSLAQVSGTDSTWPHASHSRWVGAASVIHETCMFSCTRIAYLPEGVQQSRFHRYGTVCTCAVDPVSYQAAMFISYWNNPRLLAEARWPEP